MQSSPSVGFLVRGLVMALCSIILTLFSILLRMTDSVTISFIAVNLKTHAQSEKHHRV